MPTPHADPLRLSIRIASGKPDHHLWNNNGTWWFHFTMRSDDGSTQRMRRSLRTRDIGKARASRDRILRAMLCASGRIAA
jgi:hypothetical protein